MVEGLDIRMCKRRLSSLRCSILRREDKGNARQPFSKADGGVAGRTGTHSPHESTRILQGMMGLKHMGEDSG